MPDHEPQEEIPQPQDEELTDDSLDTASGGVTEGGCIPQFPYPWDPPQPFVPLITER